MSAVTTEHERYYTMKILYDEDEARDLYRALEKAEWSNNYILEQMFEHLNIQLKEIGFE